MSITIHSLQQGLHQIRLPEAAQALTGARQTTSHALAGNADTFASPLQAVKTQFKLLKPSKEANGAKIIVSSRLDAKGAARKLRQANHVVAGDLYGNPVKLLDTLIASGHVTISAENAFAFKQALTNVERLLKKNCDVSRHEAKRELKKIQQIIDDEMKWANPERRLTLAGDTIGDKAAMADRPIVSLCNRFSNHIDVVASNHDFDVLRLLADRQFTARKALKSEGPGKNSLAQSLHLTPKEDIPRWQRQYARYLSNQKLIHLTPDGRGGHTLITHAPITSDHMRDLVRFMRQGGYWQGRHTDLTPQTLPEFAKAANALYQDFTRYRLKDVFSRKEPPLSAERIAFFESRLPSRFLEKSRTLGSLDDANATLGNAFSQFLTNHGKTGFLTLRQSNAKASAAPLAHAGVSGHVFGHVHEALASVGASQTGPFTRVCLDNGSGLDPAKAIALWVQ
ncbi:MAG: hypothetical protein IPK79_09160 [Vampirovibrionales bacterium]|nr:hypothetical protein [Vampirovibrionales bacterium]